MTDNQNADRPWIREALLQIIGQSKYRRFFWIISMIFFFELFSRHSEGDAALTERLDGDRDMIITPRIRRERQRDVTLNP